MILCTTHVVDERGAIRAIHVQQLINCERTRRTLLRALDDFRRGRARIFGQIRLNFPTLPSEGLLFDITTTGWGVWTSEEYEEESVNSKYAISGVCRN